MSLTLGTALAIAGGSALVNNGLQFLASKYSQAKQVEAQKDLFDYTWNKANSPQAQVHNLTSAGLNPSAMFGNHGLSEIGSPSGQISPIAYQGTGTTDLSGLAQFIAATADAKKKGAEMPGVEAQTQGILLDNDRKRFENDLLKTYGNDKMAAEVALAWQNYNLALQSEDLNEQEIAKRKWEAAKEKALSQVAANQRDILKKELDNKDTEIHLRNQQKREEIKTEKSKQSVNYASANASNEQAQTTRALRPGQVSAQSLENGLKAIDFDVKSSISELSKQEFVEKVIHLMSENRQGKAWTTLFGAPEHNFDDEPAEFKSIRSSAAALWESYKANVHKAQRDIEKRKQYR